MIIEGPAMERAIADGSNADVVDICVIGSGVGGAVAAALLAERGYSVLILDQGGYYHPARDFDQRELHMTPRLFGDRGQLHSDDRGLTLRHGNNVGGSSVAGWATAQRAPEARLRLWADRFGVTGHAAQDLATAYGEIEASLGVSLADDAHTNPLNARLFEGARALGWRAERVPHARKNCQKSGFCSQGCVYDAKQSMLVSYLPRAINAGARIYADCNADMLLAQKRRFDYLVVKVVNRFNGQPTGSAFRVEARAFILAAGGIGTPTFLRRLGLGDRHPHVGEHLWFNPTSAVFGLFPEDVGQWRNIPAAWSIEEFRTSRHDPAAGTERSAPFGEQGAYTGGGFGITAHQAHPATLAAALPGHGPSHETLMRRFPRIGGTLATLDDAEEGRLTLKDERRRIEAPMRGLNRLRLLDALARQAALLLASGATEVLFGDARDTRVRDPSEIAAAVAALSDQPGALPLRSGQIGGGARMGATEKEGVVGMDHRLHDTDNVYIADASVFPTSLGVDTDLTVMAFSHLVANAVAANLG